MAEIKVEKKKPVWPWILAAIIIAALVYFLFFRDKEAEQTVIEETETTVYDTEEDTTGTTSNNSTVGEYVTFIDNNEQKMGLDHEFTNEAFAKLIEATKAKAEDVNYDITRDMEQVQQYTDKITNDPYETTHAASISKAATALASTLQGIQQKAFNDLSGEATDVMDAANAIDPDKLTLDQKDAVNAFFDKAAALLEKMND